MGQYSLFLKSLLLDGSAAHRQIAAALGVLLLEVSACRPRELEFGVLDRFGRSDRG